MPWLVLSLVIMALGGRDALGGTSDSLRLSALALLDHGMIVNLTHLNRGEKFPLICALPFCEIRARYSMLLLNITLHSSLSPSNGDVVTPSMA